MEFALIAPSMNLLSEFPPKAVLPATVTIVLKASENRVFIAIPLFVPSLATEKKRKAEENSLTGHEISFSGSDQVAESASVFMELIWVWNWGMVATFCE